MGGGVGAWSAKERRKSGFTKASSGSMPGTAWGTEIQWSQELGTGGGKCPSTSPSTCLKIPLVPNLVSGPLDNGEMHGPGWGIDVQIPEKGWMAPCESIN